MLGINKILKDLKRRDHKKEYGALDFFRYVGPGLLVTVGFIDPGNWAANLASGSFHGYTLLWVVSLSTLMLILLQHNVSELGIATGLCLAEATMKHIRPGFSHFVISTATLASISTSLAEILGGAIALQMLFHIPIAAGSILVTAFVIIMLFTHSYRIIEKWIIGFVSIIGLSFVYELSLVNIDWPQAMTSWVVPSIPQGAMLIVMSVLGAVVMPHNLFLHSEIIQSRQWDMSDKKRARKLLRYEFIDTTFSMAVGWIINSAMILMAAATFYHNNVKVNELPQAEAMLRPLLGDNAAVVFAIALLLSGLSSSITSGMAGGSIFAGFYGEPYNIKDNHTRLGVLISLILALVAIFTIGDPFKGLLISQMFLSIQLPVTIFAQVYLTSNRSVMGRFRNKPYVTILLLAVGLIVTYLNARLLWEFMVH